MSEIAVTFKTTRGVEQDTPFLLDQQGADTLVDQIAEATGGDGSATVHFGSDEWDYDGTLLTVVELMHAAPAFDDIDEDAVVSSLGQGLHAVISRPDDEAPDVVATALDFEATEPIARENCPVCVGDVFPVDGNPAVFIDWPTDGPQLEVEMSEGTMLSQDPDPMEAFRAESD